MRVRWSRGAVADLYEIGNSIARDNPTAASRVLQSIRDQVRSLRNQPQIGRPGRIEGTRDVAALGKAGLVTVTEKIHPGHGRMKEVRARAKTIKLEALVA